MSGTSQNRDLTPEERLEQRLQGILDAMPIAVSWATLKDQKIRFMNKKFTQMFGYVLSDHPTVEHFINTTYVKPEHVKRAGEMWYPHFQSTSIWPIEIDQVEVDVLCKNGEVKTTLLGGVLLPQEGWGLATYVDITDRKEHEMQIEKLAMEDPLTGLANRRAFQHMLGSSLLRAKRQRNSTALLVVDLDHFKSLNDTMGHDSGDLILRTVSNRLKRGVRGGDLVCRLGGDEFAVIVDAVGDINTVEDVAMRILEEIRKPFRIQNTPVELSLSIGISIFPDDAEDGDTLYKKADEALYRAKHAGRGRWNR